MYFLFIRGRDYLYIYKYMYIHWKYVNILIIMYHIPAIALISLNSLNSYPLAKLASYPLELIVIAVST